MILRLPLPGTFLALTLHPRLLILSRSRFARLEEWRQDMVRGHEAIHAEQMRRDGWLRFAMRYVFTGRWRAAYEMEANRVNLAAYIARGDTYAAAVDSLVAKVRRSYFPRFWFGRPPSEEKMREMLARARVAGSV